MIIKGETVTWFSEGYPRTQGKYNGIGFITWYHSEDDTSIWQKQGARTINVHN